MIKIKGVTKIYPTGTPALRNLNLHINAGDFVSIVGQSGTGKTTLVKMLIAEERPNKGTIEIGGWDITAISSNDIPYLRRQIGVVFQDFKLLPQRTVYENIAFALEVAGEQRRRIHQVVPQVLEIVNLAHKADSYPFQLSGGEQQRTAIARSLVHRPKIIVADEPTGNLDGQTAMEVFSLLQKLTKQRNQTLIMVTHNDELAKKGDRVLRLIDGKAKIADNIR